MMWSVMVGRQKAELHELAILKVDRCYRHHGIDVSDEEIKHIAAVLTELTAVDVAEIFSPKRFTAEAAKLGLRPGFAVDLKECKPGSKEHWDLDRERDVREVHELMDKEEPYLLTGSPPCEAFSQLLNIKLASRDPENVKAKKEQGVRRLHTAIGCYRKQMENGRYFLHEHPDGASSWKDEEFVRLHREEGVFTVEGPMCRWGMELETRDGRKGYVFKRTRWVTNSRVLASILDGRCSNQTGHGNRTGAEPEHRHLTLIGGC